MGIMAFTPQGKTVVITAASTPPTPVQVPGTIIGATQYRVINAGNVTAYLGVGDTSNVAITNSTKPNANVSTWTIPILPATDEILTFNANVYVTASTDATTTEVFITPGDGM